MRYVLQSAVIILLLVCSVLLFLLISSYDRARAANRLLTEKISTLNIRKMSSGQQHRRSGIFANQQYFSPDAVDGGTLKTAIASDPPGLNPLLNNEASAQDIFGYCSMTLAERDWMQQELFRPMLAESWEISPDRKTYHIRLRKGIYWHSFTDPVTRIRHPKKEVTAHDVKFTVDVIKNPEVNCAAIRAYYMDLKEIKVINDHEFTVIWDREYYGSMAQTLGLFPLPRHFYMPDGTFDGRKFNDDHQRNRMIVGCGAYIFQSWESGKEIRLERNPDYIGFDYGAAPPLKTRIFKIIKLPNTRFQSLLAGELGMLGLTPEQWKNRTGTTQFTSGKIRKISFPDYSSYSYIGYNHRMHCFKDAATRRALTMLINRQEILDKIKFGLGTISKGPLIPDSAYADPELKPWPYDPEEAKKLLAQAGWFDSDGDGILERNGEKFSFTMLQISGATEQHRMLLLVQNFFAAAGIEMKLQTVEWSVLLERIKKQTFEACSLGWQNSVDPDLYQIFHSSQSKPGGDNFIGYKNPQLDELILKLRQEFDMKKRIEISRQIEKIIHLDQPYTFLFCSDALVAIDADFENVRIFPNTLHSLSFYLKDGGVK